MDYSSLPNDPDHPAGTSPWQSSPQAHHQSFGTPEPGSAPSSPSAKHSAPNGEDSPRQSEDDHDEPQHRPQRTEDTATSTGQSSIPDRTRQPPLNGEGFHAQPYQQQPQYAYQQRQQPPYQQQQNQQQPRSAVPSRYHTGARTQQRQNLPQYKLQAKITALERTGRKDPVLRFDVHVCSDSLLDLTSC